ncbi:MAG: polymer-forming cytoskeletal protein [Gemmatimonadota bacterium]
MRSYPLVAVGLVTALATAATAQQQPAARAAADRWALPVNVAEDVVGRLNDPAVDLRDGDQELAAGSRLDGDLAVLDGSLSLHGSVDGTVTVVNGDAFLHPGSVVTGDILVVGGRIETSPDARVGGDLVSYVELLPYERVGGRIRLLRGPQVGRTALERTGRSDFLITTGKSYNRVEGMPISFGPRLRTAGSNPFRLQALGIYRSEAGLRFDTERMGYFIQADQSIGGHQEFRVGATLHSVIDPVEEWQLTDLESGLATFLFHRDYRDHYQRQGWSLFATWEPAASPYRIQVESRWETHESRSTGSPWSLFRNATDWRPQPIVAEGTLGSALVEAEFDTRSAPWNPATGWLLRAKLENGFRVGLRRPDLEVLGPVSGGELLPGQDFGRFLTGLVDLRSYNRIDSQSRLNLRVVAGGSPTGDPLPPQRQHALGGEGSLPGYLLFSSDCGARSVRVRRSGDTSATESFPNYGCDAFALLQAEFRGKLDFRFRWDVGPWREDREQADDVWDFGWAMAPDWALFVDAGRGWAFDERRDEATRVDVGAGLLLERIGLYLAVPVTGGTGVNLFLRLGPRF